MPYLLRSKVRLCNTFCLYHQSDIVIGLLKVMCTNTSRIILCVTIFKLFQKTQHSILFAKLLWLCGSTLNGTAKWGIQSNVRGFCPAKYHPPGTGNSANAESRCSTRGRDAFFASLFYLDWLTHFFTRYFSQLQKGVIQKIFLKFIHLQVFCCFHGNFSPKPQLQIPLKTSS